MCTHKCVFVYAQIDIIIYVCKLGSKCCQELECVEIFTIEIYTCVYVYANRHDKLWIPKREQPPRMAKSWRVLYRCSFPPAAPALSCHASHRGHLCQVSRVNSSFSSVIGHKARKKKAARHCWRQNIITPASTVLPAILNVQLGALREQQQLREGCFPEMITQRGLEPPSNSTDSKQGDTGDAAQGARKVSRGSTGACCPVHARWIQPRQSARNAGGSCGRGQAHLHAAICTRQGAGHNTQGLCEISSRCPGACRPVRACCNPVQASPLWGKLDFAPERGAGSRNNARRRAASPNNPSAGVREIQHRPSRQSIAAYSRSAPSSAMLLPLFDFVFKTFTSFFFLI